MDWLDRVPHTLGDVWSIQYPISGHAEFESHARLLCTKSIE